MMKYSFIIPALNEEKFIGRCVRSIKTQTSKSEIIVVDNGSKDKTASIAKSLGAKVITKKKRGISVARNAGAKVAKGEIVCFIDADGVLAKDWFKACQSEFVKNDTVMVSGFILYTHKSLLKKFWYNSYLFFGHAFLFLSNKLFSNAYSIGNNMAIKKDVFLELGGFPELVAEDYWLTVKFQEKKYKGAMSPKMIVFYSSRGFETTGYIKTLVLWAKATITKIPQGNYSYKNKKT